MGLLYNNNIRNLRYPILALGEVFPPLFGCGFQGRFIVIMRFDGPSKLSSKPSSSESWAFFPNNISCALGDLLFLSAWDGLLETKKINTYVPIGSRPTGTMECGHEEAKAHKLLAQQRGKMS